MSDEERNEPIGKRMADLAMTYSVTWDFDKDAQVVEFRAYVGEVEQAVQFDMLAPISKEIVERHTTDLLHSIVSTALRDAEGPR